jgi:hypothetical protein
MTTAMIIMICVGCALIIASLVILIRSLLALFKTASAAQKGLDAQVQVLLQKQQIATERVAHLQAQQAALTDNVARLQAVSTRLYFLFTQLGRAGGTLADLVRVR